jgi:phosphopantothenoylcysteine decarboxylase/phosphopantothenate--cysteine ligase
MHCLVTAGATIEPIDEVRYLTNQSTGRLGSALAEELHRSEHQVTLLLSETAQKKPRSNNIEIHTFTTTASLQNLIKDMAKVDISAVFHVAAVSDFTPVQAQNGKINSNTLFTLKLKPTQKIINSLRNMYPDSLLIGWKYEIEGNHRSLLLKGQEQIERCGTDGCVLNGPAYGMGFGLLQERVRHCDGEDDLFNSLITLLQ